MQYPAIIKKEGKYTLAEFPDCPGCQTFSEPGEDIVAQAADALEGWLASGLSHGDVPAAPSIKRFKGKRGVLWVQVPTNLAAKLEIRWARQEVGLTQAQLARKAGVSQAMIAKVENPRYKPSLDVLDRVARALGKRVSIGLEAA